MAPGTDAMEVLGLMNQTGNTRLMVVDGDRLVGVVTLRDLMKFLAIKMELEGGGPVPRFIPEDTDADVDDQQHDQRPP